MSQPSLFDGPAPREKKAVNVPRTSVEAYRQTHAYTRAVHVVDWLSTYDGQPPTSAELDAWAMKGRGDTDDLLYVRRGLSDGKRHGLVEYAGERVCTVSQRKCKTWKVCSR